MNLAKKKFNDIFCDQERNKKKNIIAIDCQYNGKTAILAKKSSTELYSSDVSKKIFKPIFFQ